MSEESYLLDKKEINWGGRFLKLTFFISAFFLIMAIVLFNMGGANDSLKGHVEGYLSQSFGGRPAKVGTLRNMSFFPRVGIDVEDVSVLARNEGGYPVIQMGHVQVYMRFWNVATRRPRFSNLYVENLKVLKGLLFPREFVVEKIYVDHDIENGTAKLRANGLLDIHPWTAQSDIDVYGGKGKYEYALSGRFPVSVDVADIHFDAVIVNHEDDYFKVENFTLANDGISIKGDMVLFALARHMMKVKADIKLPSENSELSAELVLDLTKPIAQYSGNISSKELNINDVSGESQILSLLNRVYEIFGYADLSQSGDLFKDVVLHGGKSLDLTFDLKNVQMSDEQKNDLRFIIKKEGGMVKLGPIVNDKMRVPPIFMIADKYKDGAYDLIVQDGKFDATFAARWMPYLPVSFIKAQNLDITCATGRFIVGHNALAFDMFDMKTSAGNISISNQDVKDAALTNINLKHGRTVKESVKTIILDKKSYDFVQASLQRSTEPSACTQYVELEEQKVPAIEKEQQAQE